MKKMWKFLSVLLVFALFAGCASPSSDGGQTATESPSGDTQSQPEGSPSGGSKDSVSMAVYSDFSSFDPYNSGMTLDKVVYSNIFETLMLYYNGEFENLLATGYDLSEDGTVYTFYLKEGVLFHNGEEFTADDVVFSLNRAKEGSQTSNYTSSITNVAAIDPYTVEITLEAPYIPFIYAVASDIPMMSEKAVLDAGDNVSINPVGTGPYTYVEWNSGANVVLERFEEYHGDLPQIKTAQYVVLTSPETALIATETGEIDLTYTIPSIAAGEINKNEKLTLDLNPTLGSGYIVINTEAEFLNDVNFRTALAYATSRPEIVEVGMEGIAVESTLLWDSKTVGFSGLYDSVGYDLDKAAEYLAMTDYNGEPLSFKIGYETYQGIAIVYQEQLKKIGVNISVELEEANTWVSEMKAGDFHLSTVVMTQGPDVDLWSTVLHSNAIGAYNFSRLDRPEVDNAFDTGSAIQDPEERKAAYAEIEKILYEEVILIPIYNRVVTCAYNKDLTVTRAYDNGFSRVSDMYWQ